MASRKKKEAAVHDEQADKQIELLQEAMVDDTMAAPDHEVLADAEEDGLDPEAVRAEMVGLMEKAATSLKALLPWEISRVREQVLPAYMGTDTGWPALVAMQHEVDLAAIALIEDDLPGMLRTYQALRGFGA